MTQGGYFLKGTFFLLVSAIPLLVFLSSSGLVATPKIGPPKEERNSDKSWVRLNKLLLPKYAGSSEGTSATAAVSPVSLVKGNGSQVSKTKSSEKPPEVTKSSPPNSSVTAPPIPGLLRVPWISFGGKGEKDSFHLFSAYYDNRKTRLRPAVVVLGYAWNEAKQRPLYCLLKYEDGRTQCGKNPLTMEGIASCMRPNLGGLPYFFYCPAEADVSPVAVKLSDSKSCEAQYSSQEVAVDNQKQRKESSKTFGVCVGGPAIGHDGILQDMIDFISINKILGADVITIYIIPEKIDRTVVETLLKRFPRVLRLIEWKNLSLWTPLHYYGQYLMVQDCLYRSMYEVDYLFHQDIDEVFIPMAGKTWAESVPKIPGLMTGAGFKHQNSFFLPDKVQPQIPFANESCGGLQVPKYLTRTKRLPCFPGYNYRSKSMTRPNLTLEVAIHDVCQTLHGYSGGVHVPASVAILGHFRNEVPKDCIQQRKPPVVEDWASKYSKQLHQYMCTIT